jgi:hypothetical protein
MLPTNIWFIWQNGFRGEDFYIMHEIIGEKFVNHQAEGLSTDFIGKKRSYNWLIMHKSSEIGRSQIYTELAFNI